MFSIAKICTECFALEPIGDGQRERMTCGVCGGALAGPVAFPEDDPSPKARSGLLTSQHYTAIRSVAGADAQRA
jgi:hypothetical protein